MIEKTKKIDFDSFTIFLRKYSVITAHFCNYLWLTPNEVTVMRVIIFWVWSCILLFLENYWLNILWLLFLFLYYFFDLVDWDLARNYNKKTLLWKFLDENLDAFILNFIIFTLSLKILIFNYGDIYVIWGLLALFWSILWTKMWNIIENNFSISCVEGNKSDVIDENRGTSLTVNLGMFTSINALKQTTSYLSSIITLFKLPAAVKIAFKALIPKS